ncbi:MAG TPA: hypothetical protein VJV03_10650 [Pyrinomonadaceae bacterium]|nr:hypothetical protein [Pyrinomonadaceae bacterium]
MAEERNLGLARARDLGDDEASKEALQRRMEVARDSITNTVSEIKDSVAQQVESVKDALDWREHYKKRPVAWSLGAAGVGFFVGYGIASAISSDDQSYSNYEASDAAYTSDSYSQSLSGRSLYAGSSQAATPSNGQDNEGPGLLSKFKETSAYDRLSKEAASLGDRVIDELSNTAHVVVLPFLLNKVKEWVGLDLSDKPASMASQQGPRSVSQQPSPERAPQM